MVAPTTAGRDSSTAAAGDVEATMANRAAALSPAQPGSRVRRSGRRRGRAPNPTRGEREMDKRLGRRAVTWLAAHGHPDPTPQLLAERLTVERRQAARRARQRARYQVRLQADIQQLDPAVVAIEGQRAAAFVHIFHQAHPHGPTWRELATAIGWTSHRPHAPLIRHLHATGWLRSISTPRSLRPGPPRNLSGDRFSYRPRCSSGCPRARAPRMVSPTRSPLTAHHDRADRRSRLAPILHLVADSDRPVHG